MSVVSNFFDNKSALEKLRVLMVTDNHKDAVMANCAIKAINVNYQLEICEKLEDAGDILQTYITDRNLNIPDFLFVDGEVLTEDRYLILESIEENPEYKNLEIVIFNSLQSQFCDGLLNSFGKVHKVSSRFDEKNIKDVINQITYEKSGEHLFMAERTDTRNLERTIQLEISEQEEKYQNLTTTYDDIENYKIELTNEPRIRVLLIEDNRADAKLIETKLNRAFPDEFEIIHQPSLMQGLACLNGMEIDVITVDMGLPDASGLDSICLIRKATTDIPIVVLTGMDDYQIALDALKMGAQDYLVKDVSRCGEILGRILRYGIERKKVERLVQHSLKVEQNILKEVLDEAPFYVVRFDGSLNIKNTNPAFEKACAMSKEELVGRQLSEVIPGLKEENLKYVVSEGLSYSLEQHKVESIGKNVFSDLYLDIIAWPTQKAIVGKKEGVIICTDVSERVNFIKQKEEFIAALAHDIRNPVVGELRVLNAIVGQALGKLVPAVKSALESIIKSNNSLLLMLSNMVDVYQLEATGTALHLEKMDLGDLVSSVIGEMDYLKFGTEMQFEFSKLDDACFVSGDKTALSRVIQNLLYNAVKYSPANSTVCVSVLNDDSGNVILQVKNQGPQITDVEKVHLFDRFTKGKQGRRTSNSSGFGLYLCKKIVEGHGGIIGYLRNEDDNVFVVSIPSAR